MSEEKRQQENQKLGKCKRKSGWCKTEERREDDFGNQMVRANERQGLSRCELEKPRALVRFCPRLLSLEPQRLLSCSCST